MLHVTENTVAPAPATRERLRAPDFASGAESLARGAQGLAQGISQGTENLDKIGEIYDTAAVKQADAEDAQKIGELQGTVLASKGFDAQSAIADARQQMGEIRKSRLATLHNSRQREMYSSVFDQRNVGIEESFAKHSATQIADANQSASVARAETYSDLATRGFGTPQFDDLVHTALNETAAANPGQAPDAISRKQATVKSTIISRAIGGMIDDPDQADHAKLAIDQYAKDLTPEDEAKLRKQLNPILQENRTDADAGWAFTNAPKPQSGEQPPAHPSETPQTPPRPAVTTAADQPAPYYKPISPADPLRGKGRITDNAAAHRARGSGNALDIAAPAGTSIYPPMSGKVVKSWWDKKGGWSVLVQHPNGYVTGYAHLRSQSPYAEGQEVEADTPIGSVGATGDATGPHVHYTVRASATGPKVDPSAALWGKGAVKPDSVAWNEADPQKYTAEDHSLDRALTRLHDRAATENWSPNRYNKAVDKVRQIAGVQQQLSDQQEQDHYDAAVQQVVNLGPKFTSVSQIPGFGLLKPEKQLSLQNIATANLQGGVKPNGPHYLQLMGMSQDPAFRDQFLSADIMRDTDINPAERATLLTRQQKLRQEPDGALAVKLDTVHTYATRYFPMNKYPSDGGGKNDMLRQNFSDRMASAIERQQGELHKPLTPREVDDIARSLTVQVIRNGTPAYGFQVLGSGQGGQINVPQTLSKIAPDIQQKIAARIGSNDPKKIVAEWLRSRPR